MRDSIVNEENTKTTIRQQMKYDYEKAEIIKENEEKEKARIEAETTSRRNTIHYTAIFIGLLLVFGLVLALGFVKANPKTAQAIIFISFLIVFEFLLVVADPYIEDWSGGAPGWKLLFNAVLAGLIFPLHQFFEGKLKKRLIKTERKKQKNSSPPTGGGVGGGIKPLIIALLVISHSHIFAQTDSTVVNLRYRIENAKHDTTKAKLLVELTDHIYLYNPDTVIPLCEKAIDLIDESLPHANPQEEISFLYTKAGALNNIGVIHQQQGDIEKGMAYYFESIKMYEEFFVEEKQIKMLENLGKPFFLKSKKMFNKGLAMAYNNIGVIYDSQGAIDRALKYNFLSLKINEEVKNKKGMAVSYNNIGLIYSKQGEIDKALEYYFLSLKIREEIRDKKWIATSYNTIGVTYKGQGKMDKAMEYFFLSLKLREETKDKKGMANSYQNIGSVLCQLDSLPGRPAGLEVGMRYLELGLELHKELGHKDGISSSLSAIGGWQLQLGPVEIALESGLEALVLAKEIGHVENINRAAKLLSEVYRKKGNFNQALTMYELEIQMRDSIVNEENTKVTISQQMKYEYEKEQIRKEHETQEQLRINNEQLARRNNLHYSGIVIGLLILTIIIPLLGGFVTLIGVEGRGGLISPRALEGTIFITFLIFFEFLIVLMDPYIEQWTGGAPGYKLLINAGLAGLIFPIHQFFERRLKQQLIKIERKKLLQKMEQFRKDVEEM
ncbi:MAG: hypothetical protein COC01_06460 [Bacteroidetes bacterium]|nr:MAG: hypothetical protein COC01_06460 [Bacteroidota bacterium]